jgi:hypothetical protein
LIAKGKHFSLAFAVGKYFVYSQGKFCLLGERPTAWSTAMVDGRSILMNWTTFGKQA